jgi:hypothetical protein
MDNLLNSGLSAVVAGAARKILESKNVVGPHKQSDDPVTTHQLRIDTGSTEVDTETSEAKQEKASGTGFSASSLKPSPESTTILEVTTAISKTVDAGRVDSDLDNKANFEKKISDSLPEPLANALRAYRKFVDKGAAGQGMANLIKVFLDYQKNENLSKAETIKLYQKLSHRVVKSTQGSKGLIAFFFDKSKSALTAFVPKALEQRYPDQLSLIKLASDDYAVSLKQALKDFPSKLCCDSELDPVKKNIAEASLNYFQKTFQACRNASIPREDQKLLLAYVLKMQANAELKVLTRSLLNLLENPKQIVEIMKSLMGGLTAKIAKDPKLSGTLDFVLDSVKHGLSLPDSGRTSPQV